MRGSRDTNAYQSVAAQANGKFEISRSPVGAHLRHAPAGRSLLIGRQRTVFASYVRCKWNVRLYGIVRLAGKKTDDDLASPRMRAAQYSHFGYNRKVATLPGI